MAPRAADEPLGLASSLGAFCERVSIGLETATFEQKRELVELLIDRVVVTGDQVEIRYVFPTNPQSEHVRFWNLCRFMIKYNDRAA